MLKIIKRRLYSNGRFLKILHRLTKSIENTEVKLPDLQTISSSEIKVFLPALKYNFDVHERVSRLLQILGPVTSEFRDSIVRYGNSSDGGYFVVDDIHQNDVLLSFGVGSDISFEKSLESKLSYIHFYDHTVTSLPCEISNSQFFPVKVGTGPSEITIKESLQKLPVAHDFILKCDIEGSEWEILSEVDTLDLFKFRQIIVELHDLQNLVNLESFEQMEAALAKLASTHHLVSIQPNNYGEILNLGNIALPSVLEATFYRKPSIDLLHMDSFSRPTMDIHQNCLDRPPIVTRFPMP
jgi:hypothetical protein